MTDLTIEGLGAAELVEEAEGASAEGDYDIAAALAQAATAACGREGAPALVRARAWRAWAIACHGRGEEAQAAELCDKARALLEPAPDGQTSSLLAAVLHTRAEVHLAEGQIDDAVPLLARAVELLEAQGADEQEHAAVALTLADVSAAQGDLQTAVETYGRVLDLLADVEPESAEHAVWLNGLLAQTFFGLGAASLEAGAHVEGKDFIGRAVEFFEAARGRGHAELIAMLATAAQLYRNAGDEPAALAAEAEIEAQQAAEPE